MNQLRLPRCGNPPCHTKSILAMLGVAVLLTLTTAAPAQAQGDQPDAPILVNGWSSPEQDDTESAAWGDMDGDGDLDLFAGNNGSNRLYLNQDGRISAAPEEVFTDPYVDVTQSVAWGDMDGDGDLDLFAGNNGSNRLYLNQDGKLAAAPEEVFTDRPYKDNTQSVAWGDVDSDGDLDLYAGNDNSSRLYLNQGGKLVVTFTDPSGDNTQSVAWGDVDGDGDLDLFAGNDGSNRLYRNKGGVLEVAFTDPFTDTTNSVAWGDVDSDGDLDLFTGNSGANRLYLNHGGMLNAASEATFTDSYTDTTNSVTWGDVDSDGDLDLFTGNSGANRLYLNQSGMLNAASEATFTDSYTDTTNSVTWGDVDGDGDLDLFAGNGKKPDNNGDKLANNGDGRNRLYLNQGSGLAVVAPETFTDPYEDATQSVAWGDVDGDGDLDLFAGNSDRNRLYINQGGRLYVSSSDTFIDPYVDSTSWSVAWGDVDGDGDLDLFAGKTGSNRLYINQGGMLAVAPEGNFTDPYVDTTYSVAWGDVDGDDDLDLFAGNGGRNLSEDNGGRNRVYLNHGGRLVAALEAEFTDPYEENTLSVAWGDVDGDGDLDLFAGNAGSNRLYLNQNGVLAAAPDTMFTDPYEDYTLSVAWGDVDGDGDLDLFAGNGGSNRLYINQNGRLAAASEDTFTDRYKDSTLSVVWGDVDSDGDLDLFAGNFGSDRLYINQGGTLVVAPGGTFTDPSKNDTAGAAWGDMDGDGDLDLAVGTFRGPKRLYQNNRPAHPLAAGQSPEAVAIHIDYSLSPLVQSGVIPITYTLFHPLTETMRSVAAMFSLDGGDHWQIAKPTTDIISNIGLATLPYPQIAVTNTHLFYWDVNASGFFGQSDNVVFRIEAYPGQGATRNGIPGPFQRPFVATQTFPFRVRGNQVQVFSDIGSISNTVAGAVVYRLPAGQERGALPLGGVDAPYRTADNGYLQGRAEMIVASDAAKSDRLVAVLPMAAITDSVPTRTYLSQDSFPITLAPFSATTGSTIRSQLIISDAHSIGDIGLWVVISPTLSEKATLNLIAPRHGPTEIAIEKNLPSGHSNVVFQSAPEDAMAFCPEDSAAVCYVNVVGLTTLHGTLADGAWTLEMKNPTAEPVELLRWGLILQLSPLHYTSAKPTVQGLDTYSVTVGGVQTLTVSSANSLSLFDLNVALEWDSSNDEHYMAQLSADLRRTSELLYDWTNGQAALGNVRVYHDARRNTLPDGTNGWNNAHVRIYATNRLRPNADQGGIVSTEVTETVTISDVARNMTYTNDILYLPGQVRMGATWNRLGDATIGNLGDDWPAALAHELGHYLLFLDDNYLTIKDNLLIPLSEEACKGAMNNPYSNVYSELQPAQEWTTTDCTKTLSHLNTNRSDWETIKHFYPWLIPPKQSFDSLDQGPSLLPLAVTQVTFVNPDPAKDRLTWLAEIYGQANIPPEEVIAANCSPGEPTFGCPQAPITATAPLEVPIFYIKLAGRPGIAPVDSYRASNQARAILFQGDPYPALVDLGQPIGDQILALGARPTDRLCVFDPDENRAGCTYIVPGDDQIRVGTADGWEPQIIVSPETSRTLNINLELPLTEVNRTLAPLLRIYPANAPALLPVPMTLAAATGDAAVYSATISTTEPILEGYVWVGAQDPEPGSEPPDLDLGPRQAIAEFAIGGNPVRIRALRASYDARGVRIRAMRVRIRAMRAPVASTDGQVIVYPDDALLDVDTEWSFTLQQATRLPAPIDYATPIGRGYWLATSQNITDFGQSSITFEYLTSDVPPGEEAFIHMYFWDKANRRWQPVAEQTNHPDYNLISARLEGPGLYALFSHIDIPLESGWNLIGYPVQGVRPISEALASIAGKYSMVFGFDPDATDGGWRTYIPGAGEVVNDLDDLQFGHGYWLYITDTMQITDSLMLQLKGNAVATQLLTNTYATLMLDSPPAVYYGVVRGDVAGFAAPADRKVIATVSNKVCGTGEIDDAGNYAVKVVAHSAAAPGCGVPGSKITFKIGDAAVSAVSWRWDNQAPHRLDLLITPAPAAATDADYYRLLESAIM